MLAAHQWRSRETGDRAREFQDAMETARREPHAFGRIAHEIASGGIGPRDIFDQRGRRGGVRRQSWQTQRRITRPLQFARGGNARRDIG